METNSNPTSALEEEINSVPQTSESEVTSSEIPVSESQDSVSSDSLNILDGSQSLSSSESMVQNSTSLTQSTEYENWMDKPLDEYTTTEGLLLILVVGVFLTLIARLFRSWF